ncbi:MAG: Ig-like domain-containing protein [Butyrivibrio sp.]|nr:Ig-like domain-containing protein [Butyrivibrio sp.]
MRRLLRNVSEFGMITVLRRITALGLSVLLLVLAPYGSGIGNTVLAGTESDDETGTASVTGIEFTDIAVTIGVGQKYQLQVNIYPEDATDKSLTWKSTNSSVVAVSQSGVVTGKKKGAATIDAVSNDGGLSASVRVTVTDSVKVTGVKLNKTSKVLKAGKSFKLKANVKPSDATNKAVTWKSSNKKIAKVDKKGKVTAVKKGKAVITVKTKDGKYTAKCKITVK